MGERGGVDPWEVAFDAVAEVGRQRILEVGPGPGEFAERLGRSLGAEVIGIDISPRMVELARARGVDARLDDVQDLEFEDDSFDCAGAAWMLYTSRTSTVASVGSPACSGRAVAWSRSLKSEANLSELWSLLGPGAKIELAFNCENTGSVLARYFPHVRRQEVAGAITIATREDAHRYVSASVTRRQFADRLPADGCPLRATRSNCALIAEKAAA